MNNRELKRATEYADHAMSLLRDRNIPPIPRYFELLYTYSSGVNPELNARLNEILGSDQPQSDEIVEKIYADFIGSRHLDTAMNAVSQKVAERLDSMHSDIAGALSSANSYSGSLEAARSLLDGNTDREKLKKLAMKLLQATQQMQKNNTQLEDRLESSRRDIQDLHRNLEEVRQESTRDPLTRIFNRGYFDQAILAEMETAKKAGTALCLLMIDIDHFKLFNDKYGHQTGDQVLRLVAMTLQANARSGAIAARFGGEEFATILPACSIEDARAVAESIRKAIQSKELLKRSTNQTLGRITASIGVAQMQDKDTANSLIDRADKCLYAAKKAGRNSVVMDAQALSGGKPQSAA